MLDAPLSLTGKKTRVFCGRGKSRRSDPDCEEGCLGEELLPALATAVREWKGERKGTEIRKKGRKRKHIF